MQFKSGYGNKITFSDLPENEEVPLSEEEKFTETKNFVTEKLDEFLKEKEQKEYEKAKEQVSNCPQSLKEKKDATLEDKKININMGLGNLANPEIVFARAFRFNLFLDRLPHEFIHSAKVDYLNKTVEFKYYDIINGQEGFHAIKWADELKNKFTTGYLSYYDGCGMELARMTFSGIELLSLESGDLDYASSEVSLTKIKFKYKDCKKILTSNKNWFNCKDWKLRIEEADEPTKKHTFNVHVPQRPQINVEEIEVNRLHGKFWVPGKCTFKGLRIQGNNDFAFYIRNRFIQDMIKKKTEKIKKVNMHLDLYQNGNLLETWDLVGSWVSSINHEVDSPMCEVEFRFDHVQYKNNLAKK